jgi:carboxypeptidase Taq
MDPSEKLNQLKTLLAEVADLNAASAVLSWDLETYMPPAGAKDRGEQLATLRRLAHIKFTSPEIGELLDNLKPYTQELDPDSFETRLVKVTSRRYDKRTRVPPELVAETTKATTAAHQAWQNARAEDDFAQFQPHLEKIVDLQLQYAELFAPFDHIYDPLLDDYEPGLKTADVKAIFDALRPEQVALIKAIAEHPQVDDSFLHEPFDEGKQWDFGVEVITAYGYDWNRGRQDKALHPFTTGFGLNDVRITTRVDPNFLNTMLFGTLHEAGHALYGLGTDPALARTPLVGGSSAAVHESQSRMWENLVGRSYPFWEHFYPRIQEYFPAQLGNVSLNDFYKGINRVKPSLIRVEADEATYNLHIMLRLEIEMGLMEGALQVKDLPDIWNSRMQEYLGVSPPDDADGVLQDIHWSAGLFGYFSSYALGNLISGQLWECINADIPELNDQIRVGEFSSLLAWLVENIHQHGAKFEPQELVQRVTGSKIDPAPYIRYLKGKYSQVYGF